MASDILDRIGDYIKDNNPYFNSFRVNGIQLPTGEVIEFTDGKEKRFIGIADNFGTSGYIRSNPKITVPTSGRRISSATNHAGYLKQCRLVAYSWSDQITSEALMTKLVTDIKAINFTGNNMRVPVITIKNTNHNYLDLIKEEFLKEPKEVGGYGFVCISVDFDLQYWSEECSICEIGTERVPMRSDSTAWGNITGDIEDQTDLVEYIEEQISAAVPNIGAYRVGVGDASGVLTGYSDFTRDSSGRIKIGTGTPSFSGQFTTIGTVNGGGIRNVVQNLGSGSSYVDWIFAENPNRYFSFGRLSSTYAGNLTGTSIPWANMAFIESSTTGGGGSGPAAFIGSVFFQTTGNISNNYAVRTDQYGVRIDKMANIHTPNTDYFAVHQSNGSLRFIANSIPDFQIQNADTSFVQLTAWGGYGNVRSPHLRLWSYTGGSSGTVDVIAEDFFTVSTSNVERMRIDNAGLVTFTDHAGSGNRIVHANASGDHIASISVDEEQWLDSVVHAAQIALLENAANWTGVDYTGSAITGTYQGQMHKSASYFFVAFGDNQWIRMART